MVDFKINVADPKTGKTFALTVKGQQAHHLIRRRIGDTVEGITIGIPGYKLKITGGTDKDGFVLRPEVQGPVRKALLVTRSIGFHPLRKGLRSRITFRGNEIGPEVRQVNLAVVEHGNRPLDEIVAGASQPA